MQFSVGVNYWPRSSATAMWRAFDAGEIAEDFGHMAALGFDGVRFFVRWDDFAPEPDRVDTAMVDRLETLLTIASDARLRAIPVLFCGHTSGANYLPAWALDRKNTRNRFPTMSGNDVVRAGAANVYGDALREPQLLLARTIGRRFADHPAIRAWDIGNACSRVREPIHAKLSTGGHSSEPAGEREMAAWSTSLSAALRETSRLPATATASFDDLSQDRDVRLGVFDSPFAFTSLGGLNVENAFARSRLDPEATPFFAMLAAAFSYKPVFVSAFGIPSCTPGKFSAFERFALPGEPPNITIAADDSVFATYPCAVDEEIAPFATAVLDRLQRDGRLGAYWYAWADYPGELHEREPFVHAPHEAVCGIIRSDGTEKPVASALSAFARERRDVADADEMPMIGSAYYYRTLPKSARSLYETFLRHVRDRRAM